MLLSPAWRCFADDVDADDVDDDVDEATDDGIFWRRLADEIEADCLNMTSSSLLNVVILMSASVVLVSGVLRD